jgi:superfamily I DNA/RNA helicase
MAFLDDTNPRDDDSRAAVQLMTLHKAKGLEFSVVILVGLDEHGILSRMGFDPLASLEQQKNAVYVGVTRARNLLVVAAVDAAEGRGRRARGWRGKGTAEAQGRAPVAGPPSIFLTAMYKHFGLALNAGGVSGRIPGYPADPVCSPCTSAKHRDASAQGGSDVAAPTHL